MLAAADPPAELVQLGDPVALGALDEHHRRVRDVDPDLDHRRRDEHVGAAGRERRHRLLLLARLHLPVQQHDAEVAAARSCAAARTPRSRRAPGAPRTPRPAGRRRTPGGPASSSSRIRSYARARSRLGRRDVGVDRPPPRRQVAQDGHVEVAVGGQRQRARDRRRRHVEHVRREVAGRLAVQRAALVDAEAVLLVDHGDGEPVELHRALDQRVRADEQLQLPARELAEQVGAAARGRRARQERRLQQLARHELLQRREVLLGERLGRRHQRRLGAVLDRAQHRVERDDGLAGADLPHQQPLHRPARGEVAVDGLHRAALVVGRRERERLLQPARGERRRLGERLRPGRVAPQRAAAEQRDLQQQQLVERQPHAPALLVAEVRGGERRGAVGPARRRRAAAPAAARRRRAARRDGHGPARRSGWSRARRSRGRWRCHRTRRPRRTSPRGTGPGSGCGPGTCPGASAASRGGTCAPATAG